MRFRIGSDSDDLIPDKIIDGDGKWHHVALTRDSENNIKVFIDGELESSSYSTDPIGEGHFLTFGKSFQPDSIHKYFCGKIDEILIYNRTLSEDEISLLFLN